MQNKYIKNGIIVLTGQITVAISGLIMVRVLTEWLSPADYGLLTLGITFSLIANQVIFGPLGAGITRFFASAVENEHTNVYLHALMTLAKYAITILAGFTCVFVLVLFWSESYQWAALLGLGMLFSIATGVYGVVNGIFLAKNAQIALTIFQCSEPLTRLAFAMLLMTLFGATSVAALAGYILGTLIVVLFQVAAVHKTDPIHVVTDLATKTKWQEKILHYALPFASWGIFTTIHLASDRWILNWTQGQDQVGLYAVLYQIGYLPVTMAVSVLAQIITPQLYAIAGDGTNNGRLMRVYSVTKKVVIICIGVTLILVMLGLLLHELVYDWFVSKSYASVSQYLPLMVFAAGIFASGQVASLALQSGASAAALIPIKIGSAFVGVILNFILGSFYGIPGIAIALALTSLVYLAWVSFFIQNEIRNVRGK